VFSVERAIFEALPSWVHFAYLHKLNFPISAKASTSPDGLAVYASSKSSLGGGFLERQKQYMYGKHV